MFRHGSLTMSPRRVYSDIMAINRNVPRERHYIVAGRYALCLYLLLKIDLQRDVCVTTVNLILILRSVVQRRGRIIYQIPHSKIYVVIIIIIVIFFFLSVHNNKYIHVSFDNVPAVVSTTTPSFRPV